MAYSSYLTRYVPGDTRMARRSSPVSGSRMYGGPSESVEPREYLPNYEPATPNQNRVVPQYGSYAGNPMARPGNAGAGLQSPPKKPSILPEGVTHPLIDDNGQFAGRNMNQLPDAPTAPPKGFEGAQPSLWSDLWRKAANENLKGAGFIDQVSINQKLADIKNAQPPQGGGGGAVKDEPLKKTPPSGGTETLPALGENVPQAQITPNAPDFNLWYNNSKEILDILKNRNVSKEYLDKRYSDLFNEFQGYFGNEGWSLPEFDKFKGLEGGYTPQVKEQVPTTQPVTSVPSSPPYGDIYNAPPGTQPMGMPQFENIFPQYEPSAGETTLNDQLINAITGRLSGQGMGLTPEQLQSQYSTQFEDLARAQKMSEEDILQRANERNMLRSGTTLGSLAENTLPYDMARRNIITDVISGEESSRRDEEARRIAEAMGLSSELFGRGQSQQGMDINRAITTSGIGSQQYGDYLSGIGMQQGLDMDAFTRALTEAQYGQGEEQRLLDNLFRQADWERQGYYTDVGLGMNALNANNQFTSGSNWMMQPPTQYNPYSTTMGYGDLYRGNQQNWDAIMGGLQGVDWGGLWDILKGLF